MSRHYNQQHLRIIDRFQKALRKSAELLPDIEDGFGQNQNELTGLCMLKHLCIGI
jgi:hypothetical protein